MSDFHEVGTGKRVDRVRHAGFVGDDLLRAQSDARGLFGGQGERFVEGVGVQRLRSAEHRRQRLQRGADDVVLGLLRGEGRSGGLRVEAQHPGFRAPGAEVLAHNVRPHAAGSAEFRYLLEEVLCEAKKNESRGAKPSMSRPASSAA